jgi:hypothetical protein
VFLMKPMAFLAAAVLLAGVTPAGAGELTKEQQRAVERGLAWLARQQRRDGRWEAPGGRYPIALTGLAGTALLMEGSTTREGAYQGQLRKAIRFLMARSRRDGLIGDRDDVAAVRVFDHAFALRFLAAAYGDEEDADHRRKLEDVLTRAVDYTVKGQTSRGGWGYLPAAEGGDFDEAAATVVQLQALFAARNAGIVVPRKTIERGRKYLANLTNRGGVLYGPAVGLADGRPGLTAAAVVCAFEAGEYDGALVKQWVAYCRANIPLAGPRLDGSDRFEHPFTHYFYARVAFTLGDRGYAKLFPKSADRERVTWEKYKAGVFKDLVSRQAADGSWRDSVGAGPVYATACYLTVLQTETSALPLPQR